MLEEGMRRNCGVVSRGGVVRVLVKGRSWEGFWVIFIYFIFGVGRLVGL